MKLAIIAAGEGSRLKNEGIDIPKPLIKINGIFMIDRIILAAVRNGIDEVFCIVNENSIEVADHLRNNSYEVPVHIKIKTTQSSLHSVYELSHYLPDDFLLTTVDSVFNENEFAGFIEYARACEKNIDAVLAVTNYIDDEKPLCVELDDDDKILSFHNKKNNYKWATGGIYFFRTRIFTELQNAVNSGIHRLRNLLNALLLKDYFLQGYKFSKIIDVDHAEDIFKAEEFLKDMDV